MNSPKFPDLFTFLLIGLLLLSSVIHQFALPWAIKGGGSDRASALILFSSGYFVFHLAALAVILVIMIFNFSKNKMPLMNFILNTVLWGGEHLF